MLNIVSLTRLKFGYNRLPVHTFIFNLNSFPNYPSHEEIHVCDFYHIIIHYPPSSKKNLVYLILFFFLIYSLILVYDYDVRRRGAQRQWRRTAAESKRLKRKRLADRSHDRHVNENIYTDAMRPRTIVTLNGQVTRQYNGRGTCTTTRTVQTTDAAHT